MLLIIGKFLLATVTLWVLLAFVGNLFRNRDVPWWFTLIMSGLISAWGYLEYLT